MNSLYDLKISPVYEHSDDIEGFYNDTLSVAKRYLRVSAYFDPKLFKFISKGILGLLKNKGQMQLLVSTEVSENTLQEIKKGYSTKYVKKFAESINFSEMDTYREKIKELYFLISIGLLDVKIAFKEKGILHEKYGIVIDNYENEVLFSGSNNETLAALQYNYESFETTCSWDTSTSSKTKIERRKSSFERMWNNHDPNLTVVEASEYVAKRFAKEVDIKSIPEIRENIIVFDLISDCLLLKSNFDLTSIYDNFEFRNFRNVVEIIDTNNIRFRIDRNLKDISLISSKLERVSKERNFIYIEGNSVKTFIDNNTLDLTKLAKIGSHIKSQDIKLDSEFVSFFNTTNQLLNRSLREAQGISAYHIVKLGKVMNFSVPGSGKTATVLGAFEYLRNLDLVNKIIVVGPINCFKAWKEEYLAVIRNSNKFDILDLHETDGKVDKDYALKYDYPKSNVILINFEGLGAIADSLSNAINDKTMLVFDEIHRIKNPQGIRYLEAKKLVKVSKYIVALTGTPLPNGYLDLHNLFEILYQEYSKSYFNFTQDKLNELMKKYLDFGLEDKELNEKIFPFYTRVSKRDLQIEPVEEDNLIYVETTEEENLIYKSVYEDKNIDSLAKITNLVRIGSNLENVKGCSFDDILIGSKEDTIEENNFNDLTLSSKLKKAIDIVVNLVKQGKNVIVWSVFIKTINKLKFFLDKELNPDLVKKIYGQTDNDERDNIINGFNENKVKVIITNPHTLAESVSLHKNCHDAVYVELNFNLAQYLQSRDRIHRLGIPQGTKTNYYILINKYKYPSIEDKIYKRLGIKTELMYASIDKGELMTKYDISMDLEELLKE